MDQTYNYRKRFTDKMTVGINSRKIHVLSKFMISFGLGRFIKCLNCNKHLRNLEKNQYSCGQRVVKNKSRLELVKRNDLDNLIVIEEVKRIMVSGDDSIICNYENRIEVKQCQCVPRNYKFMIKMTSNNIRFSEITLKVEEKEYSVGLILEKRFFWNKVIAQKYGSKVLSINGELFLFSEHEISFSKEGISSFSKLFPFEIQLEIMAYLIDSCEWSLYSGDLTNWY